MNFHISPMDFSQVTAAMAKVSTLLCPSEYSTLPLYSVNTGTNIYVYAVSNYVGNYGGPAAYQPYTGTIVPGYDVEQGMNANAARLPIVGLQSITDGTSNTGLFSERLCLLMRTTRPRRFTLTALRGCVPSSLARCRDPELGEPCHDLHHKSRSVVCAGMQCLEQYTAATYPAAVGVQMFAGNPAYVSLTSYMHWTAPNSPPCTNSLDSAFTDGRHRLCGTLRFGVGQ